MVGFEGIGDSHDPDPSERSDRPGREEKGTEGKERTRRNSAHGQQRAAEAIAGEQLQGGVKGQLLRVLGGDLTTENDAPLNFLNGQAANPSVGRLPNPGLHLFDQGGPAGWSVREHSSTPDVVLR